MGLASAGGCAPAAEVAQGEPGDDADPSPDVSDEYDDAEVDSLAGDAGRSDTPAAAMRDAAAAPKDASQEQAARRDGSIADGSASADGTADGAAMEGDAAPRLSELVESFFVPTCVLGRCHTTLAPAGNLSLTGRRVPVHEALVNATSSGAPPRLLVVPGDPAASYLLEKLESDDPAAGTRMPPPPALLPRAQVERLRAWILAGAKDD